MKEREILREITEQSEAALLASGNISNGEGKRIIDDIAFNLRGNLSLRETGMLADKVFGRLRGKLGILSAYLADEEITEIMVNGPEKVFVERRGKIEETDDYFESEEELEELIRRIAASVHREINELNPILDARLPDGSRVCGILKNIALEGPALTVRKFRRNKFTMEDLVNEGALTEECKEDLKRWVEKGKNIFVCGGTSSGKTTLLNALSDYVPKDQRVITVEDSAELKLDNVRNLVSMECRNANSLGKGTVSMGMLIKASLRMRPDRLIVGEVRGEEVTDMLQALNTGHSGMSTGHGNSIIGMLRRLEAMYLMGVQMPVDAVRGQITEAVDMMIHVARFPDGKRRIVEVADIRGYANGRYDIKPLYKLDEGKKLKKVTQSDMEEEKEADLP